MNHKQTCPVYLTQQHGAYENAPSGCTCKRKCCDNCWLNKPIDSEIHPRNLCGKWNCSCHKPKCCEECSSDPTGVDYSTKEQCIDKNCDCHEPEAHNPLLTNGDMDFDKDLAGEPQDWEEKFDEQFRDVFDLVFQKRELKAFIRQTLEKQHHPNGCIFSCSCIQTAKQEERQRILGMLPKKQEMEKDVVIKNPSEGIDAQFIGGHSFYREGFNDCLATIKSLIKGETV